MYKWNGVVTAGIICGFPSPQGGGTVRLLIDEVDRNSCCNFFRISLLAGGLHANFIRLLRSGRRHFAAFDAVKAEEGAYEFLGGKSG